MGLLRDWTFVEERTRIPALSEIVREALVRALFCRDDRVLPREVIAVLSRPPAVTVKVHDDGEIRKLVAFANGEETSANLGFSAEDYHYFRKQLSVGRATEIGFAPRPKTLLTYDWMIPEPRGILLDFSAYAGIEIPDRGERAVAQVGATWKATYDAALAAGHILPFVPAVPLDFAIGDGIWGDAPFVGYDADFASCVLALRTISAYGHRTQVGFQDVSNEGTGYDLLHLILPHAAEFFIPVAVAARLLTRPAARKTLTYRFDDPGKLGLALDRLTRSGRSAWWANLTDAGASALLWPGTAPEPFTLQVAVCGTEAALAGREKALDALLAGFKAKAADVPNPYDVPEAAYRKTADRIGRALFVGEVRLPSRAVPDLHGKLTALAQQAGTKVHLFAALRGTGTASAFPAFEAQKDRTRTYDLSKGVDRVAGTIPGALFASRLAHLWREDDEYVRRVRLLRALKLEIDAAHVVQPLAAV